jgi:hypothetical protein
MKKHCYPFYFYLSLFVSIFFPSCGDLTIGTMLKKNGAKEIAVDKSEEIGAYKQRFRDQSIRLQTDLKRLRAFSTELENLINRMGSLTLTADDILEYYFSMEPKTFDFILYAEEDPLSGSNRARIFIGAKGEKRVRELMATTGG